MNTNDTTASTWTIEAPADLAFPVLHVYPRQNEPQSAFIEIDFENKTVRAAWNPEIGNASPMDVYLSKTHRLHISAWTNRRNVKKMLDEVAEVIEDIAAGYETRWDGQNERGHLSAESEDMMAALYSALAVIEQDSADEWADYWDFAVKQRDHELARVLGEDLPEEEDEETEEN